MAKIVEKKIESKISDYIKKCLEKDVTPEEMTKLLKGKELNKHEQEAVIRWEAWH